MTELRTLLERTAGGYQPPPNEYRRTLDRAARTHRRRRIGTAFLALVLAAAGLSAAALAFVGRSPGGPASRPQHPIDPKVGELAYRCGDTICLMRPDGSGSHELLPLGRPLPQWDPAWSPDGSKVAFRGYYGSGDGQYALYSVGADGCGLMRLTRGIAGNPTWSPDGRHLAFDSSGEGAIYEIDTSGHRLVRLTPGAASRGTTNHVDSDPAWSSAGVIAFVRYPDKHAFGRQFGQLFTIDPVSRRVATLTHGPAGFGEPAWSPDGTRIAAVRHVGKSSEVVVLSPDGSDVQRVSPAGGYALSPTWSPDGSKLAFLVLRQGTRTMYTVNADGSTLLALPAGAGADQVAWGRRPLSIGC